MNSGTEVTVWTDAARVALVRSVLELMGSAVAVIGVGGPRAGEVDTLAAELGVQRGDDARRLLIDRPAAFVLLATMERAALEEALNAGSTVLALEPVFTELELPPALTGSDGGNGGNGGNAGNRVGQCGRICRLPTFTESPGWRGAADPVQAVGQPQLVQFTGIGPSAFAGLHARLDDAWRAILASMSRVMPQTIEAVFVPGAGGLAVVPSDLRGLSGSLSVHAWFAEQRCAAAMQVSDQVGLSRRELRMVGGQGVVRIDDAGYELHDTAGKRVEFAERAAITHADLIVLQWRRLLDQAGDTAGASAWDQELERRVLACSLACLLSARTGQPESPRKLLEMHGRR